MRSGEGGSLAQIQERKPEAALGRQRQSSGAPSCAVETPRTVTITTSQRTRPGMLTKWMLESVDRKDGDKINRSILSLGTLLSL